MRETEMRAALRSLCEDLDRNERRSLRGARLASTVGIAALALSACVDATPRATTDAQVDQRGAISAKDSRVTDVLSPAVGVYSAPGCSWVR
jgi:hypothetical protein